MIIDIRWVRIDRSARSLFFLSRARFGNFYLVSNGLFESWVSRALAFGGNVDDDDGGSDAEFQSALSIILFLCF